ncbi:uncharacterized protein LOC141629667 [Silene latifolia]|uniref:uncharacterized protein LOC141629667 n=1 Tax=Silene latifolia TaxID=37657 RepID=UPI003D7727F8
METRVKTGSINKVHQGLGTQYSLITNNVVCGVGRIWVLWDDAVFMVDVVSCEPQVIHCRITYRPTALKWCMSFVYGYNKLVDRDPLWLSLESFHSQVYGPWIVCGVFNNVLGYDERIGSTVNDTEIRRFNKCVDKCDISDVPAHGAFYTWSNKQDEDGRRFSRIDRALVNMVWLMAFPDMTATFLPEGLFDHNPCVIEPWSITDRKRSSFKYFNMWGRDEKFMTIVEAVWRTPINGITMFQIVRKLKLLKRELKELNKEAYSNVEAVARLAKIHLEQLQKQMQNDMGNCHLWDKEKHAAATYRELDKARTEFLAQKAKVQWAE